MKRFAWTIAAVCAFSHASAATDSAWLLPAPVSLGAHASWQTVSAGAFVEVGVSKFALAQAILSERAFVSRTPTEVSSLLGSKHTLTCNGGSQPYLVRALYNGTGEFSLLWAVDTLVVAHGSLGAGGPVKKSALVACLAKPPAEVVSIVGGAI